MDNKNKYDLGNWLYDSISSNEFSRLYSRIDKQQFYSEYTPILMPRPWNNLNKIFKDIDKSYILNSQDVENHYDYIFTRINLQFEGPDPHFNLYKNLKSLEFKFKHRKEIPIRYLFNRDHYRGKTMTQRQHACSQNFNTRYDYDHNSYQAYRFGINENED